ncbi:MAG: hybrid sensor histidine kinase/response regulator [Chloroflexi bacterium]|nr:hybrid sensor histidine kinase/response regulator [Chloroflexota bacterium]
MASSGAGWDELRATFSLELDERVPELNRLLLHLEREALEDGEVDETVDALFREAHSLKGAARAVQLPSVEQLAHALESALHDLRHRAGRPPAAWFDAAYRAVDALKPLHLAALEGSPPQDLTALLATLVPAPATAEPRPPDPAPDAPAVQTVIQAGDGPMSRTGNESVRVAVTKLDALLGQAGELAVTHIRVAQRLEELERVQNDLAKLQREWRANRVLVERMERALGDAERAPSLRRELTAVLGFLSRADDRQAAIVRDVEGVVERLREDSGQLGVVSNDIEDDVMAVRLLPIATVFSPFERMVRDLARHHAKDVRLVLEGADTEIDRKILEQLRDPVMHMLRNAVDHGIERPDRRAALGKPAAACLRLSASQRGGEIRIELEDDGAGLDAGRIRETAVRKGLLSPERAAALDDRAASALIFQPGFSTAEAVTETSGRGVGMDVVRENVEGLNGHVAVESVPGKGTLFVIGVPLTLATTRAVLVEQGGQRFAVPSGMIEHNARLRERELVTLEGRRTVTLGGAVVPVVELGDILERPERARPPEGTEAWRPYFVIRQAESRLAVLADHLIGEQEIVVKSLGWPLRRVRNVGGAAVLGSGDTVVILNPFDMLKSGLGLVETETRRVVSETAAPPTPRRHRVLVVDDSLTTRTLERTILEAAGYETVAVADGAAALDALRGQSIDLVVSDVEMPRLDGFALTAEIRRDERLRHLPVVLVTSLEAREHRERGVAAGADAYIEKSGFSQGHLLDTIGRLL